LCPNMWALMLEHQIYSRFGLKMHKVPFTTFVLKWCQLNPLEKMLKYYNEHLNSMA
jgi:hypothetical protein